MNIEIDTHHVGFAVLLFALVSWRVYRRVQRLTTRQLLRPVRTWLAAIFFPLLIAALLFAVASTPLQSLSKLVGVTIGVVLAIYALRHTNYEVTSEGLFYTPNRYVGGAIAILLVGRIVVRLIAVYAADGELRGFTSGFLKSPFTLFVVGILAGYYAYYAFGLLCWRARISATPPSARQL